MKRILTLLIAIGFTANAFGNPSQSEDNNIYGPISPFFGLWWTYLYPEGESLQGIEVRYVSSEVLHTASPILQGYPKKSIPTLRIIRTVGSECPLNVYELLRMRVKTMVEQIEELAKTDKNIKILMRGRIYGNDDFNIYVYSAKGNRNQPNQTLVIRYGDGLFDPIIVADLTGELSESFIFPILQMGNMY